MKNVIASVLVIVVVLIVFGAVVRSVVTSVEQSRAAYKAMRYTVTHHLPSGDVVYEDAQNLGLGRTYVSFEVDGVEVQLFGSITVKEAK